MKTSLILSRFFQLLLCTLAFSPAFAQDVKRCGTDEMMYKLYQEHPELKEEFLRNESILSKLTPSKDKDGNTVYIIPVVFHILHQNGPENISDEQCEDAIRVMNIDFRLLNADTANTTPFFKPLSADVKIEFRLATTDPNGNCTNGIDRIYTARTNVADDSSKLNPWPREKYLNIWTARALETGWAAYAYYPSAATGDQVMRDGILTLQDYVGSIGTSTPYKSRTLTHEVGHWLDLGHPWNRTINISINVGLACGDDGVDDTPTTKGHSTCPDLLIPDCKVDQLQGGIMDFANVTTSSGVSDPTPKKLELDKLDVQSLKAVGVGSNSTTAGSFSFTNWGTGAPDAATNQSQLTGSIDLSKYYEFTIDPKNGNSMQLQGLGFTAKRSNNGPRNFSIRTSRNNYASDLAVDAPNGGFNSTGNVAFISNDNDSKMEAYVTFSQNHTEGPVTFRIYTWNSETANGSFAIDNLFVDGTAGIIENIQNHMEYSYCTTMYTKGQSDRMRAAIESPISGRNNLWTAQNLQETGVTTPQLCSPLPDFYSTATTICAGSSITYTKNISRAKAATYAWEFEGGSPSTSTSANPIVVNYANPGTYKVKLTASNAQGENSITKTEYVVVTDANPGIPVGEQYSEGFETPSVLGNSWIVSNPEGNSHKWQWVANQGIGSSNCVLMNAFDGFEPDVDELISPVFDARPSAGPNTTVNLSFKYAAASRLEASKTLDELTVLYSTDCGQTWQPRTKIKSISLYKNPLTKDVPFVTDGSTVWTTKVIAIPNDFKVSRLRIKFQYASSDSANNLYLDDINIGKSVGISESTPVVSDISIAPNPACDKLNLNFSMEANAELKISMLNLLGQEVATIFQGQQSAGEHQLTINRNQLPAGVYLIKMESNGHQTTKKLIWND